MALSNSYDWSLTRDQIITQALRTAGALGDYESATTNQINNSATMFNALIKSYMNRGMPVWKTGIINIDLADFSAGQVTIGLTGTINTIPKPMAIHRIDITYDPATEGYRELTAYDRNTFFMTDLAQEEGVPNSWFYVPERIIGTLMVHQRPNSAWQATGQLRVQYQKQHDDVDAGSDDIDFPAEWHLVLIYELADLLSAQYSASPSVVTNIKSKLKELKKEANDFDTEMGSIFLRP